MQAAFETEESTQKMIKIRQVPPGKLPDSSRFVQRGPKTPKKYKSIVAGIS